MGEGAPSLKKRFLAKNVVYLNGIDASVVQGFHLHLKLKLGLQLNDRRRVSFMYRDRAFPLPASR